MPKINGNQITLGTVVGKGGVFNQVQLKNLMDARKPNERFRPDETVRQSISNSRILIFSMHKTARSSSWISNLMNKSSLPRIGLESELHSFKAA